MTVESFNSCKELFVVSECNEDLGVVSNGLLEDGKGALGDFVLFEFSDLGLVQFGLWDVDVLAVYGEWARRRRKKNEL